MPLMAEEGLLVSLTWMFMGGIGATLLGVNGVIVSQLLLGVTIAGLFAFLASKVRNT